MNKTDYLKGGVKEAHPVVRLRRADLETHPILIPGEFGLSNIVGACERRGIDVLGVSVCERERSRDYRWDRLREQLDNVSKEYDIRDFGNVIDLTRKEWQDNNKTTLVATHQAPTSDAGSVLVIGAADLKEHNKLEETIEEAKSRGLILLAESPFATIRGLGFTDYDSFREFHDHFDGFTWNSQLALVPLGYSLRGAEQYWSEMGSKALGVVPTSDAHMSYVNIFGLRFGGNFERQIGPTYIKFVQFNYGSAKEFLDGLRKVIRAQDYNSQANAAPMVEFLKWKAAITMRHGLSKIGLAERGYESHFKRD